MEGIDGARKDLLNQDGRRVEGSAVPEVAVAVTAPAGSQEKSASTTSPNDAKGGAADMFSTDPTATFRRTILVRLALCLLVVPLFVLSVWGLGAVLWPPLREGWLILAAFAGAPCFGLGVTLWFSFQREAVLQIRLYDEGISGVDTSGTTSLRWDEISEIWLDTIWGRKTYSDVFPAAVATGSEANVHRKSWYRTADSIVVRLVGGGKEVDFNSYYKDADVVLEAVLARANPRFLSDATRRLQDGLPVSFGAISLSSQGIAYGQKAPVAFDEIEAFGIDRDRLRLKAKGGFFAGFSCPIRVVRNLFVLMEIQARWSAKHGGSEPPPPPKA